MIIVAIIALAGVVITVLYNVLSGIPSIPQGGLLMQTLNTMVGYYSAGVGILYSFTYENVVKAMVAITIAFEVILYGYKFVMWIAKKIPMFGVSD